MAFRSLLGSQRFRALIRFGFGGVLSFLTTLGVTALLHEWFSVAEAAAAAAGFVAALIVNFFFLRYVVFRSKQGDLRRQLLFFLGSTGVFRGLEYLAFLAVNTWLHYSLALIAVLSTSFLLKFFVYDKFVFARRGSAKG